MDEFLARSFKGSFDLRGGLPCFNGCRRCYRANDVGTRRLNVIRLRFFAVAHRDSSAIECVIYKHYTKISTQVRIVYVARRYQEVIAPS